MMAACPKCDGLLISETVYVDGGMTFEQWRCVPCGWRGDMAMSEEARKKIGEAVRARHARERAAREAGEAPVRTEAKPKPKPKPKAAEPTKAPESPIVAMLDDEIKKLTERLDALKQARQVLTN